MRVLLDTCVLAELRHPRGNPAVKAAVALIPDDELYLSALVLGEVARGIALLSRRSQEASPEFLADRSGEPVRRSHSAGGPCRRLICGATSPRAFSKLGSCFPRCRRLAGGDSPAPWSARHDPQDDALRGHGGTDRRSVERGREEQRSRMRSQDRIRSIRSKSWLL